ncbi:class I SAM-dependent methyltransferase [Undibacterium sp. TJN25]|uniref:class I SAM-dependent methyltransferase n=1 Tax=Undibacterium sp. TJN25 TaxID=3413056 RepID=UPI003BF09BBC
MSDWTSGYVADIGYTYGYYSELNPLRVALGFLNAGLVPPANAAVCELGFGQGVSINIHAAAQHSTQYWGTDFNPAQAGHARALAEASGADVHLFDQSFEEFCSRTDLPEFDYIGLHGIWSWISDENRHIIVDFLGRRLKVGGVLYISYNTQPGWAAMLPMRHLLTQHAETMGSPGQGIVHRIDAALEFADKLLALNPLYTRANSQVAERFKAIKTQNRHYVAHEYFNRDWHPMHFSTMLNWLAPAKLSFACSVNLIDDVPEINLTAEQQALLKSIPDSNFRETTFDMIVNQQFRRDYWIKGARKLNSVERGEALRKLRVVLCGPRNEISLKVKGALGEATLSEAVYKPLLDLLSDHAPRTLGQIESALQGVISFPQLLQAALILGGTGNLNIAQEDKAIASVKTMTDKLNIAIMQKARGSPDIAFLASPVTGSGIGVSQFDQLFLLASLQGNKQPEEWAAYAWQVFSAQEKKLIKDGKPLESAAENLSELTVQAIHFAKAKFGMLQKLGIGTA